MSRARDTHPPDARARLAALYDAFAAGLYRHALMILANTAAAEDAVQQAFVKLAAMGRRIDELESQENYLRIAVRNECYRMLARKRDLAETAPADTPLLIPVDVAMMAEEERQRIEQALRALPPDQREVVHLKVYEGWTFQRIADTLGIPINTAASRYRYAMDKLRQLLADCRHGEV